MGSQARKPYEKAAREEAREHALKYPGYKYRPVSKKEKESAAKAAEGKAAAPRRAAAHAGTDRVRVVRQKEHSAVLDPEDEWKERAFKQPNPVPRHSQRRTRHTLGRRRGEERAETDAQRKAEGLSRRRMRRNLRASAASTTTATLHLARPNPLVLSPSAGKAAHPMRLRSYG
ncbi:hypothetical protein TRAPUB_10705 [Trametes pubescens]|uniref:Uncharacterized protein n=1 Tax=Trametes pubescens TaxID=154538 RepID=A0A1M2VYS6_TRAPU|nr:hypothetical protein TRAPUB_10705 [Trametes pubescens]